ncbi:MAG: hypothetical protein DI565_18375 [Ancylobacter novellus]|uniref:ABC transporter domain-containing protein n=1 Tax=Ancylobacter novellus TaxID=921 RepID=A0A2W5K6M9_ANCNO|nr:MAG: hypothetical protein DI565_18375 [Ancylobacter novellus]
MFELRDVWKAGGSQKDAWLLAGTTLSFPSGRRIALLGPDSAQNSAAIRLLAGIDEPDRGVIRRTGAPCWPLDFARFLEMKATLVQNANFLAQVYGVNADDMAAIAVSLSGVRAVRGKLMTQYTGPDRRALALGLTLALQFDWYFVDEKLPRPPAETAAAVEAAVADRFSRASVIWSTTKPETLEGFCDAGLLLDQGTLTFYSTFAEAVDAFQQAYGTEAGKQNDRKSRKADRRRRAARRSGEIDPQNLG